MAHSAAFASTALPSYEDATSHDPIPILAPYLRREDLYSCSLVSRTWHAGIEDELWGEPSECWGFGEKTPLTSFILFLKYLPKVPLSTRRKVHTLNLERVVASIYTSLPGIWWPNILVLLPELRRALLPSIPFVDHGSLLSRPTLKGDVPHYNLRHLDISNLTNTTSKSLVNLLSNMTPSLTVLDISRTNSAGHPDVLRAIGSHQRNLKSLKLRWLKIPNETLRILIRGIQVRLERLDVTGNLLTDDIARDLLDWCFMPPEFEEAVQSNNTNRLHPIPAAHDSDDDPDPEFGDEEEWMTARKLQRRELKALGSMLPDIYGVSPASVSKGLMHLHISNNKITSAGIWTLLNSTRLRTLDCGVIYQAPLPDKAEAQSKRGAAISEVATALSYYGFRKIRNLRIDHEAVIATRRTNIPTTSEKDGGDEVRLLNLQSLPRLKVLALTNVPSSTDDDIFVTSFKSFLGKLYDYGDVLETVVLEIIQAENPDIGFYDVSAPVTGGDTERFLDASMRDFSFFEDEKKISSMDPRKGGADGKGGWRVSDNIQGASGGCKRMGIGGRAGGNGRRGYQAEVSTLDLIREWRAQSRTDGRFWRGNVKIMRDVGGPEASERGVNGNRWGFLGGTA